MWEQGVEEDVKVQDTFTYSGGTNRGFIFSDHSDAVEPYVNHLHENSQLKVVNITFQ